MKILNYINCIHDNKIKYMARCNLLHGITNPSKRIKNINSHYYPILHGCMNTRRDKVKFNYLYYYWIVDVVTKF